MVIWSKDLWPFYVVVPSNLDPAMSLNAAKALDEVVGAVEAQLKKLRTIAMLDIPATGPYGLLSLGWVDLQEKKI